MSPGVVECLGVVDAKPEIFLSARFLKGAASSYLHHLSYAPTWLSIKSSFIKVYIFCSFRIEQEITLHCESESLKENVAFSDRFALDAKSVDVRSIGSK